MSAPMKHILEHLDHLSRYEYRAVQNGHIRVLEVLPGQGHDPVVCSIHEISLDEHPDYEALSYVWGDPRALVSCIYIVDSATAGIHLKDSFQANDSHVHPQQKPCFLQITPTLHSALTRLRHPEQSRRLWVDAIRLYLYRSGVKGGGNEQPLIWYEVIFNLT